MTSNVKTILSGAQPSGIPHLGNYFGTMLDWKKMINAEDRKQDQFFFMVADLHSLTTVKSPEIMRKSVLDLVASYLAIGISPLNINVTIFCQSAVPFHTELAWILNCITPLGWLERMTQFKDKTSNSTTEESINLGLLSYPVLQAADILLYNTDIVPVGEDQKQHLELTRDLADKFNRTYDCNVFIKPEAFINPSSKRIMSLTDGKKKMSKSDTNQKSCIYLTDSNDEISEKISKAKTDSNATIDYNPENRPEIANLLNIFSLATEHNIPSIVSKYETAGTAAFKKDLTEAIINIVSPIREQITRFQNEKQYVISVLNSGNQKASFKAKETFENVKKVIGI